MKKYIVYMHIAPNGKKYIGITQDTLEGRSGKQGRRYMRCAYFYSAISKYGWENIAHIVIASGLTSEEAKQREIDLISDYKTHDPAYGYNLTDGGDGVRGYNPSDETRKKLSMALMGNKRRLGINHTDEEKAAVSAAMIGNQHLLGHKHSRETRMKMSDSHKGRIVSEETRMKLSTASMGNKSNLGRKHTEETKVRMSEAKRGKPLNPQHLANIRNANVKRARGVECLTLDGKSVARYVSIGDAIRETSMSKSSIWRACTGKQFEAGGFKWQYI